MMRLGKIYDAIAKDIAFKETHSSEAIVAAMTAYCLALKKAGKDVPLWSEKGVLQGVHARLECR